MTSHTLGKENVHGRSIQQSQLSHGKMNIMLFFFTCNVNRK